MWSVAEGMSALSESKHQFAHLKLTLLAAALFALTSCNPSSQGGVPPAKQLDLFPLCDPPKAVEMNRVISTKSVPMCVVSLYEFMQIDLSKTTVSMGPNRDCFLASMESGKRIWEQERDKFAWDGSPESKWKGVVACDYGQLSLIELGDTGLGLDIWNTPQSSSLHTDGESFWCFDEPPMLSGRYEARFALDPKNNEHTCMIEFKEQKSAGQ